MLPLVGNKKRKRDRDTSLHKMEFQNVYGNMKLKDEFWGSQLCGIATDAATCDASIQCSTSSGPDFISNPAPCYWPGKGVEDSLSA